jgi:NO-binding membrane sensor protein with MHYT domain
MNDPLVDSSLPSLWLLAVAVLLLTTQLGFAYLRDATRQTRRGARLLRWAGAGVSIGTGLWSAMLLGLSSQALGYPVGFSASGLLAAWCSGVLAALLALAPLLRWMRTAAVVGAGVLLAAGVLAVQLLLVWAVGPSPGITWQKEALVLAGPLAASGYIVGLWVAFLGAGRSGMRRRRWRVAAAALVTVAVTASQELVLAAAAMGAQTGSDHAGAVSAVVAGLVAGAAVPSIALLLLLEQALRRQAGEGSVPARRKRGRIRTQRLG